MALSGIDFNWRTDPLGYRLIVGRRLKRGEGIVTLIPPGGRRVLNLNRDKPLRIAPKVSLGERQLQEYRPSEFPDLFSYFSQVENPEDLLHFVERYGPLTPEGFIDKGELVAPLLSHAAELRYFLLHLEKGPSELRRVVARWRGAWIADVEASLDFDPVTAKPRLRLKPSSLLDFIWLQFGQVASGDADMRSCQQCGRWFSVGRGKGPRRDAKFCSDEHRLKFNNQKRARRTNNAP